MPEDIASALASDFMLNSFSNELEINFSLKKLINISNQIFLA